MSITSIPILMYHGIEREPPPARFRWHIAAAAFERQMIFLKEMGFATVELPEVLEVLEGRKTDFSFDRPVLITFDDALESQFEMAFPILEKLGFRATLFVPTNFIESIENQRFEGLLDKQKFMSWQQVLTLKKAGWDICSHGHEHLRLGQISAAEASCDLFFSKKILEGKLGTAVEMLAFPFGDYSRQAILAARKLGFRSAFSVHDGLAKTGCDLLRLPRIEINQSVELSDFQRLLETGHISRLAGQRAFLREFLFQNLRFRDFVLACRRAYLF